MKLIIQIPCFNEEKTLPRVIEQLPRKISGIEIIEYLVIDDCSTDATASVAQALGVHHIVRIPGNNRRWLGRTFQIGVDYALSKGADIVVNTDGDDQYPGEFIPDLVAPIISDEAQITIGDRNPGAVREFSATKRLLQRIGNRTISFFSAADIRDAVSGFRAYSREALLQLNVVTDFTYTIDTLVQAEKKGLAIKWIPIRTNPKTRESRLIKNLGEKVARSILTLIRLGTLYNPEKVFLALGILFAVPGIVLLLRFFYFYLFIPLESRGHIQSVAIGGVCIVLSAQMIVLSVMGHLLSINRRLIDNALGRLRGMESKIAKISDDSYPGLHSSFLDQSTSAELPQPHEHKNTNMPTLKLQQGRPRPQ